MSFGKKMLSTRKKLRLSSNHLAEKIGISRSYLTLIENDKRLPSKKLLGKISKALKLDKDIITNWYLESIKKKIQ
jgi:transcriptional regulator with XRE-family HTH domain